ncbi:MAG: 4Fe-4S ferredoxin [Coleofasciculus sp. S288]|nr:4Fe-4S ferredoxin [Coleofasciculus sp. S288]
MSELSYPLNSLREGHWFKLICGASFQHLPAVRNLTLAYTLAGADCVDVAADPAVIASAKDALQVANKLGGEAQARGFGFVHRPWLMVSLNDGEDPHFRKAEFNPDSCPAYCPRPCEKICPAQAIVFRNLREGEGERGSRGEEENSQISNSPSSLGSIAITSRKSNPKSDPHKPPLIKEGSQNPKSDQGLSGVIDQHCYGCGRCLPVCPSQLIYTRSYVSTPEAIAPLILQAGVDALEIHTQVGHFSDFQRLWRAIAPWVDRLKLLAISCPDGEGLIDYLWKLHALITPLPCLLVWQTDGRPMSGDIGIGATRAAVKLSQKVLNAGLPGYVQLAGGTNNCTVAKLKAVGLLNEQGIGNGKQGVEPEEDLSSDLNSQSLLAVQTLNSKIQNPKSYVAGVAYGSYARTLLSPILEELEDCTSKGGESSLASRQSFPAGQLEEYPTLLWQAVAKAHSLVAQIKSAKKLLQPLPK